VQNAWIEIIVLPKYKMHAKAILIDDKYLFIWSINFSDYSIDKNREVWILLKNTDIIDKFLDIFKQDIKNYF
jgi:phosphatidylserine/phosphatidylglycerophosphate/cardiolipin synthase-like enzyme